MNGLAEYNAYVSRRNCIYAEGEIVEYPSIPGCPEEYYPGNPLVDYSDVVEVLEPDPGRTEPLELPESFPWGLVLIGVGLILLSLDN